jgi:energy-coupling factor transporter transmembrane protein EcfT
LASRLAFHYFPGDSVLHRWDARCKFLGLVLATFGLLHMDGQALVLFSILLAGTVFCCRLPVRAMAHDLKAWSVLLVFIFVVQAFGSSDAERTFFPWLPVSKAGLTDAVLTCWRLGLMLGFGVIFTLVTKPRDLQNGLIWYLQPFPFLPAQRIALMLTLTIRLIPLIMDQMDEVALATRSRLGHQRKDLLRRAKFLVLPIFRRSLVRADELATALAARGYREDRSVILPRVPLPHWLALIPLGLCVMISSPLISEYIQDALAAVLALM